MVARCSVQDVQLFEKGGGGGGGGLCNTPELRLVSRPGVCTGNTVRATRVSAVKGTVTGNSQEHSLAWSHPLASGSSFSSKH